MTVLLLFFYLLSIPQCCDIRGISGDPQLVPHDVGKRETLGKWSKNFDCCNFSSQTSKFHRLKFTKELFFFAKERRI